MAAVLLAGAAAVGLELLRPYPPYRWWQPLVALTIGGLADLSLINFRFGPSRHSFTWAESFILPGIVLVPEPWLVLAVPVGVLAMHLSLRRPLHKAAYNAMGLAAGVFMADRAYLAVHGSDPSRLGSPSTLIALGLASLVFFVWNQGTVVAAIALSQGLRLAGVLRRGLVVSVGIWIGNTLAGVALVGLYEYDHRSLLMLPVLLGLVYLAYRGYLQASQEADTWRLLQSVSAQLTDVDTEELARSVTGAALSLFGADFAELMVPGPTGSAQVCRRRADGLHLEQTPTEKAAPGFWPRIRSEQEVFRATTGHSPAAQREEMKELGLSVCVAAPLLASGQCLGMLRVGFRDATRMGRRQSQVLPMFVNQVATSVCNAQLFERTTELSEQSRAIAESLGEGVIAIDTDGLITFANPAAAAMVGHAWTDLRGRPVHVVLHGVDGVVHGPEGSCPLLEVLERRQTLLYDDHRFVKAGAGAVPAALTASPIFRGATLTGAVIAVRDMTERRALEAQLSYQALHDPTTDLANRTFFLSRLHHALAERPDRVGLLFMDLDRFKVVNDSLGHRTGDALLRLVAERVTSCLGPRDTLARWGGDEFIVLLDGVADDVAVAATAERILAAMARPFPAVGREVVLSLSVGGSVSGALLRDAQSMIHGADVAMTEAKKRGRETYVLFGPGMEDQALERLDLETELRHALEAGELWVLYQPIVSIHDGSLAGVEALVRWSSSHGLLGPSAFIGLAEDTGLILPLGRMVLEEACRTVRRIHQAHPDLEPLGLSVNLSARQFLDGRLGRDVADILAATGLEPRHLCLEITETVIMGDLPTTLATLNELKALGVRLAIDDFGTGYSSLSYLKRFPIDVVKIDKSFVDGLGEASVDTEIVAAVIRMSASLGIKTVAEGVETAVQLDQLKALGCPLVQGYYYSPAQPAERIEAMVEHQLEPGSRMV